jgi:Protein of unknown function (DUF3574)
MGSFLSHLAPPRLVAACAVLVLTGCVKAPPPAAQANAPTSDLRCTQQTTSRLYLGFDSPAGPVTDAAWQDFVDREVTPRLPDGFTVLVARGQWRGADGVIRKEDSRVLDVVAEDSVAHRQALAEIAGRYKLRFSQQSVLVTQSASRACS